MLSVCFHFCHDGVYFIDYMIPEIRIYMKLAYTLCYYET